MGQGDVARPTMLTPPRCVVPLAPQRGVRLVKTVGLRETFPHLPNVVCSPRAIARAITSGSNPASQTRMSARLM